VGIVVLFRTFFSTINPDSFGGCTFALFIAREIAVVYFTGRVRNQALVLRAVSVFIKRLLKPHGKLTAHGVAAVIEGPVVGDFVDKEQAKHLNANIFYVF